MKKVASLFGAHLPVACIKCLYAKSLQEHETLQEQSQEMQRPSSPEPGHSTEVSVIFFPLLGFGLRRQVLTEQWAQPSKHACVSFT